MYEYLMSFFSYILIYKCSVVILWKCRWKKILNLISILSLSLLLETEYEQHLLHK